MNVFYFKNYCEINFKTNLFEVYVNFVGSTKEKNTYFKLYIVLLLIILSLFSFKYPNENVFSCLIKDK